MAEYCRCDRGFYSFGLVRANLMFVMILVCRHAYVIDFMVAMHLLDRAFGYKSARGLFGAFVPE